jgi:anaerobic magnesium-protoporphyrin IX monomethyl ester cyclase
VNVLFVYPDLLDFYPDYPGHYYEGIASLSAFLKSQGHRTALIHVLKRPADRAGFLREVREHAPGLIAFSSTTLQFVVVRQLAGWIKQDRPDLPVICGGVHASLMPEETLACRDVDMVCIGEGERALADLCDRLEAGTTFHDIPNLWVRTGEGIRKNPALPPAGSLDDLPFADRSIFRYETLWWEKNGTATVMGSRGCPYHCRYCCNHALRKIYAKKPPGIRRRSVAGLLEEIRQIRQAYPFVRSLNFDDDILFMDREWAREFSDRYAREVGLEFFCNMRPNLVDPEIVALLKKAGCREVRIGLESGNDRIRNEVLNRNISLDQIRNACRWFREAGIPVRTFNIIGFPEETPAQILETIRLNAELGIPDPQYTIFYPFPGTHLYDEYKKQGLLLSKTLTDYYTESSVKLPGISPGHLRMFQADFLKFLKLYHWIFRLPPPVRSRLAAVLDTFLAGRAAPPVLGGLHRVRRMLRSVKAASGEKR